MESEKKKVLFILKKWEGGVGNVVKVYNKYLEREGWKVYTLAREEDIGEHGMIKSIRKIRKAVKKREYDLIITNDWSITLCLLYPYPVRFKKHYAIFHGAQEGAAGMLQKYTGWIMETFGRLIVVSEKMKRDHFKKAKVVCNGVDGEVFKVLRNVERDPDKVGFANWRSDVYKYEVIKKAVEMEGKKIVVAEGLNKKQMVKFYNEVGMLVSVPPKGAGHNMVWNEAIFCGVPKVVGNKEGVGEEIDITKIEPKEKGLVTVDDVRYAMRNAKNVTEEQRQEIKRKFNAEKMVEKFIEVVDGRDDGK